MSTDTPPPLEQIEPDDLYVLKELKTNILTTNLTRKLSDLEWRNAELTYETAIMKIYLKYGLTGKDSINELTGDIHIGVNNDDEGTEEQSDEGASGTDSG